MTPTPDITPIPGVGEFSLTTVITQAQTLAAQQSDLWSNQNYSPFFLGLAGLLIIFGLLALIGVLAWRRAT